MKKIIFILFLALTVSGCASLGANPYILSSKQTTLDLTNNRGVALFTLKVQNSGNTRLLLSSFNAYEANQYKPYNSLSNFYIPLSNDNYSAADDLYFCTAVLTGGIYRIDAFSGMTNAFFAIPYSLKTDKIFDIYPNTINYLGRLDFGALNTQTALMPLKSVSDSSGEDIEKFKTIFPVLKDKKIENNSFY